MIQTNEANSENLTNEKKSNIETVFLLNKTRNDAQLKYFNPKDIIDIVYFCNLILGECDFSMS